MIISIIKKKSFKFIIHCIPKTSNKVIRLPNRIIPFCHSLESICNSQHHRHSSPSPIYLCSYPNPSPSAATSSGSGSSAVPFSDSEGTDSFVSYLRPIHSQTCSSSSSSFSLYLSPYLYTSLCSYSYASTPSLCFYSAYPSPKP